MRRSVIDGTIVFLLEPFHSIFFANSVLSTDSAFASSSKTNSASWSLEDDVKVHTENTGEGIILDTQIDVLLNTKAEASSIREVAFLEFSVLDFQASLQDFVSFISTDCDVNCDLLVSLDAETSDCESSSRGNWFLTGKIFKNFAC